MYPLEKYKFYQNGNKVIAVSTYAGRTVRGTAICDSKDTFDLEKGKRLAAARCNFKVAQKRVERAEQKYVEALQDVNDSRLYFTEMESYLEDACTGMDVAYEELQNVLEEM